MSPSLDKLFPFLGLRGKLLIAFIGLALGPLAVLALYSIRTTSRALTTTNADHLRIQLGSNIGHIESYLALLDANAQMFSRWIQESGVFEGGQIDADGRSKVERFFYHWAWMRPDYYQLRVLCERGREQVRINRYGDRLETVPLDGLQDKSDRYYFKHAMAVPNDKTYFSPLDLNVEHAVVETPHQLVFRVARKTFDREGRARGLVVMNVFASEILDRVKLLRPDPSGDVVFVGDEGQLVREECSDGRCAYTFGLVRDYLKAFGPHVVASILSGEAGVMVEGQDKFISYAPIRVGGAKGERRWRLAIIYPRDRVLGPVYRMRHLFYVFAALVAAAALLLAGLATRALTTPIRSILRFVQGVAVGDFRQDLTVETRDEIEQLADGVRHTATALEEAQGRLVRWNEELQSQVTRKVAEIETLLETKHSMGQQLLHADRLASLGMLSASLAHEVGNPLAAIRTVIQVHLREPSVSESTREALELVLSEIDRLAEILGRITGFVRPARERPVAVTLAEVFRRVTFLVEREARKKGVVLRLEGDGAEWSIMADAQRLEQVLLNLLVNSLQALDGAGSVTVTVQRGPSGIDLTVDDTGPGIPEEARPKIFEPFFTTKAGGTGLGLPIVRQILREMGGDIRVECPEQGGTSVSVHLPAEPRAMAAQEASS